MTPPVVSPPMSARVNWRDAAACRQADPDLFFPVGTTGPALHQIDEAKRICRTCPARVPCLDWALEHRVGPGVWGGTTEEERAALRQNLAHRDGHRARQPGARRNATR